MQLGGVEEVIDLKTKYDGPIIVRVATCIEHPDSDHMHICTIDDGGIVEGIERDEMGHVQVVCGAPNVRAGMYAAWLPPRTTVPASFEEAELFVLGSRELRGVMSHGMLASPKELALGDDHNGILEIDPSEWTPSGVEIVPGIKFAPVYGLDDTIIDIENKMFTHRPDCFGQLGVAREISAILKGLPKQGEDVGDQRFVNPDWYWSIPDFATVEALPLTIFNDVPEKVPRFMAVALKGITVAPSPLWLRAELVRMGSKPINNVVDVTNYLMLLTGQPSHAYDYDKLNGATLGARMAKDGETATFLNGKTYELTSEDVVITDASGVVGLAGIIGAGNSEVSAETINVVVEVANFDMYTLRKSSMQYGVFTDALTRFSKGQSRLQTDRVLGKIMEMLKDLAGGAQASMVYDLPDKSGKLAEASLSGEIKISTSFVNERLGSKLSVEEIGGLLRRVNFASYPLDDDTDTLLITAPFWRTDIIDPEDIVEEVGRLYGFDKLPRELPVRSISPTPESEVFEIKKKTRAKLASLGANEVLTYSFVHEKLMKNAAQDSSEAYRLSNALSPDLQYFRLSLTPSLLEKVHGNIKAGHDKFALFELGKAHRKGDVDEGGLPIEYARLAFVYTAKKSDQTAYFVTKDYLMHLVEGFEYVPMEKYATTTPPVVVRELLAPYEPSRSAVLIHNDDFYGVIGEFKQSVLKAFKLPEKTAGFEVLLSGLVKVSRKAYTPLSKFPSTFQDITLEVSYDVPYADVRQSIDSSVESIETDNLKISVEDKGIYSAENSKTKNVTFGFKMTNAERTMTDDEAGKIIGTIVADAVDVLHAKQI